MKTFKIILLLIAGAFTVSSAAGQANAFINVLTQNSGQVTLGGTVFIQVDIGNTGPVSDIGVNKVRAQISVPISICSVLPTAQQTGLPPGWIVTANNTGGAAITVCNGSDIIAVGTQRTVLIAVRGDALGGPLTVAGVLSFGPGTGVCTGPGSLPGDNIADNTSTSSIQVISGTGCNLAVSASTGIIPCNGGTTTLTATPSGASGAVEYSLNGGAFQSGNTFTLNAAGSPYTVTVREVSNPNCTATTAAVIVTQPSVLAAIATSTPVTTTGGSNGTATAITTGGTGPYTYSWNTIPVQTTITATNLTAGTYTVTVKDVNLCTTTAITTVAAPVCNITASASAGTIACFGGTTTLTATTTGGNGALQYSLNGGAFQSGNIFTVNAAGSPYTVAVREVNNPNCTATSSAVTVIQPSALTATATSTPVTTTGGSNGTATAVPVGGTLPYTYSWSTIPVQTTITATNLTAGTYTVTVKDANLCTTTAMTTVGSPLCNLSVVASAGTIACNGGTTTLTATPGGASGAVEYSLNGGAFQSGNTFTVNATGSPYTVTVREVSNPTCTATATIVITQPSVITASASAGTIACNGGTTTLTVTSSGGTGTKQYSLNGGAFQSANTFTVAAGTYTVTVRDANFCTVSTALVTVTQPTVLTATATSTPVTTTGGSNGTATAVPAGGTAPYTYSWNTIPVQTTITATNLTAGTYIVTVKDANLCTTTAITTVASPVCNITATVAAGIVTCNGGTTALTVTATGTGVLQYSLNGGTFQSGNTFIVGAGTYTVTVREAANPPCTATTIPVTISQPSAVTAPIAGTTTLPTCIVATGSVVLSGLPSTGIWTITRLPGSLITTGTGTGTTITGLTAGTYTFTVTNAAGCTSAASIITITQPAALTASATAKRITQCGGMTIVTVTANGGTLPYNAGTGTFTRGPGTWSFPVTDAGGCTATASITIEAPGCMDLKVYPNPVSNSININHSIAAPGSVMKVFDINGSLILSKPVPQNSFLTTIDVSRLAAGSYVLVFFNGNEKKEVLFEKITSN